MDPYRRTGRSPPGARHQPVMESSATDPNRPAGEGCLEYDPTALLSTDRLEVGLVVLELMARVVGLKLGNAAPDDLKRRPYFSLLGAEASHTPAPVDHPKLALRLRPIRDVGQLRSYLRPHACELHETNLPDR